MAASKSRRKPANPHIGFKALKARLAQRPDVRSPGGLTKWIGVHKYGAAAMKRAAARGQQLGNPNVLIHQMPQRLFKSASKRAISLAQLDADRSGKPVAIVDEQAGRVLRFIRPRKRSARQNPKTAVGRYRIRRKGGRQVVEVYRA